ncbi:MAG: hypothetical protein B7C24_14455 [Bacteroidetes bacterium 4572_77]|nr:MAG: hypothetical protein B7C24_14455 [Bacteroidetes bacterium 4572_77]
MKPYTTKLFWLLGISILLFSACRKDNRPADLHTDTNNLVFKKGETTQYFSIVNTGNSSMDYQISVADDFLHVTPSNGILGFNEIAKIRVDAEIDHLDYGLHQSSIMVNSNGGISDMLVQIYKPLPDPAKLWWDIDYIKINSQSDRDYVIIRNDGEEILDYQLNSAQSWISYSQSSGSLAPGAEDKVWIIVDRTGLSNNLFSGIVRINSNGGAGQIALDMEVNVYSVTFFNPTYTPMQINVPGMGSEEIGVLNRMNYVFDYNPQSIFYRANTHGEAPNGQILGVDLVWQETIDLSNEVSPIFDLNVSEYFYFLSVMNYGIHSLDNWSMNYDTDYQIDENILIPNDGREYTFGYYDALNNSNVYARMVGTDNDAVWENGYEFDFLWTLNQSILLESSLKSSGQKSIRPAIKSPLKQATIKVISTNTSAIRKRNARSLVNGK